MPINDLTRAVAEENIVGGLLKIRAPLLLKKRVPLLAPAFGERVEKRILKLLIINCIDRRSSVMLHLYVCRCTRKT